MRIPNSLMSLADQGMIEEVVRPLMSGKEAEVFLVRSGGELRVAKVYKEAQNRTFKNRAEYTEGRKVRNSRDQRAINKRSSHGRAQDEAAWRSTEVDMIYRLRDAGVRVPTPYHFIDGVLIMELITDAEGTPAPRLAEVSLEPDEAVNVFDRLLAEVIRMLCAGVVHCDLSDFNVLMGADGPVVIDFPQSVDASSNQNARKLLLRDVDNLQRFLSRFAPNRLPRPYAQEMWELYSRSQLTPETRLTGRYRASERRADTASVLELIGDANFDERSRRESLGLGMRGVTPAPRNAPAATTPSDPRDGARSDPQLRARSKVVNRARTLGGR
jgi:RIO kinase 1